MAWFERRPRRLAHEREVIESLRKEGWVKAVEWVVDSQAGVVHADIDFEAGGLLRQARLELLPGPSVALEVGSLLRGLPAVPSADLLCVATFEQTRRYSELLRRRDMRQSASSALPRQGSLNAGSYTHAPNYQLRPVTRKAARASGKQVRKDCIAACPSQPP